MPAAISCYTPSNAAWSTPQEVGMVMIWEVLKSIIKLRFHPGLSFYKLLLLPYSFEIIPYRAISLQTCWAMMPSSRAENITSPSLVPGLGRRSKISLKERRRCLALRTLSWPPFISIWISLSFLAWPPDFPRQMAKMISRLCGYIFTVTTWVTDSPFLIHRWASLSSARRLSDTPTSRTNVG